MKKKVALLDAGAQLEKVIMRRVLEQGYEVDKFPVNVSPADIQDYDAIIISGGPKSVNDYDSVLPNRSIYTMGKPILGICYGLQAITHQLGGEVVRGTNGQYGRCLVDVYNMSNRFFAGLSSQERVLMSHFDTVAKVPEGFNVYAKSNGLIAAIADERRQIYATQFHPELIPVTKNGEDMFSNFFRNVCGFPEAEKRTIHDEIDHAKNIIRETVGPDKHVMHYLSGGVDSTVMALLLEDSIEPERLHMRTLDTGTMRIGEIDEVKRMAAELNLPHFEVLHVADKFYATTRYIQTKAGSVASGPLYNTIDPEHKRKLFGTEYALIALTEMSNIAQNNGLSLDHFLLGQGTLRPDMIESGDKRVTKGEAHTIKTHHNAVEALGDIPKVEPLIELFKDQVREMALELGLPESFAYRQPFPGPGLYCRIIGDRGKGVESTFTELDKRVHDTAKGYGFNAHALPIRTVGVQGDERSYKHPVLVSGDIDWNEFSKLALELPNEISDINRVLYSPGKPLNLEESLAITPTTMNHEAITQCQECDLVMREVADEFGYNDSRKCSQMPGILIPSNFGVTGHRSFVIRPVWTHDFMAIVGMMPSEDFADNEETIPEDMFFDMASRIPQEVEGISRVILDASDKPPGSTEWE